MENNAKNRLLDRVKALLSKTTANGCTEAEAMAAAEKARAIMDEHGLNEVDLETGKEEISREEVPAWAKYDVRSMLAVNVAKFCDVRVWRSDAKRAKETKITFLGHTSDVTLATYLLDTLSDFVIREADGFKTAADRMGPFDLRTDAEIRVDQEDARRSFAQGCTERINERLKSMAAAREGVKKAADGRSLIVMKMALVDAEMRRMGIVLHARKSTRTRGSDFDGFAAGKAAGDRAHIGGAINGGGTVRQIGHS